jgi:hypothetical protein
LIPAADQRPLLRCNQIENVCGFREFQSKISSFLPKPLSFPPKRPLTALAYSPRARKSAQGAMSHSKLTTNAASIDHELQTRLSAVSFVTRSRAPEITA